MGLRNLNTRARYRTNKHNVVEEFIIPALKEACVYDRAIGYFSSDALINYADGLIGLLSNNGEMRLIASPMLTENDILMIQNGCEINETIVLERLIEQLKGVSNLDQKARMDIIANLISINKINIRIAYRPKGIYHEKIGIIKDLSGDYLAFDGSMNETFSALFKNVESISVFKSWVDGTDVYADDIVDTFEELWNGRADGVKTISLPDAVKTNILNKYKTSKDLEEAINNFMNIAQVVKEDNGSYIVEREKPKTLYEYQVKAVEEFVNNGYRHFFEMATGTGKTFTAVNALKKLIDDLKKVFIIILVPQIDLQSQWLYELNQAGIDNIYGIGGIVDSVNWEYDFDSSMIDYNADYKSIVYVAVYDSFFAKLVNKINRIAQLAIVVDEAHNLSNNQLNNMPKNSKYRLGLSATPEKHNPEETKKIIDYFIGGERETYKYTIEEAIENNFLSRYEYHPIFVQIQDEEFDDYIQISKRIAMLESQEKKDYDVINRAKNERSLIIKKAKNKLYKLEHMIEEGYNFKNSVIYCGQGKIGDTDERMIDAVTKLVNKNGGYCVSTFTSETGNRKLVLEEFKRGFYDVLVAIKCFDEGVDVPKLDKIYILSSDRLIRQTIQRRGRVLRICKESGKNLAYIYDFVVLPPEGTEDKLTAKSLVKNEFYRVKEYMRLSENKTHYSPIINSVEMKYSISEEDYLYDKDND